MAGGSSVLSVSEAGISADHADQTAFPVRVSPTREDHGNTIRQPLTPIACWRVDDPRFHFDSSFLRTDAEPEFTALCELSAKYPDAPATLFGHADPTGNDDYNKTLSGRRVEAVYAVVTRNADMWERLYSQPFQGDAWGVKSEQVMLAAVGFDPGPADGQQRPSFIDAVKAFQQSKGLSDDGDCGPKTRHLLFLAYMDRLCHDAQGTPFSLAKEAFLGKGADPAGKLDYQGCGEFNPLMMFSAAENAAFKKATDKTERDRQNAVNRRVLALFFPPGTTVDAGRWPCPTSRQDGSGCRKRFWSDAKTRRSYQEKRRWFSGAADTFACRFYQGMAGQSPCEQYVGARRVRVRVVDHFGYPVVAKPFIVLARTAGKQAVSDADGMLDVMLPIGRNYIEGEDGRCVYFDEGYDFYKHEQVPTDSQKHPFPEAPRSKDGQAESFLIDDLVAALASIDGEG